MKLSLLVLLGVLFLCLFLAWPLVIIWSLNTLFVSLSIPYSFWTYLAVMVLNVSTFGGLAMQLKQNQR